MFGLWCLANLDFPRYQNGFNDPKVRKNMIVNFDEVNCTVMKYMYVETFYGRKSAINTSCSEIQYHLYKLPLETKNK